MKITLRSSSAWVISLPLLAVFVEPFGRSVEVLVLIMALIGLYDLIKNYNQLRQSTGFKLFSVFFLCFWIPALLSLPDAVNFKRSATTVAGMLRFYFAGLFLINRLKDYKAHLWLGWGISLVLFFWAIDGWVQAISGNDLFGIPSYSGARVSGIFGKTPRLGLMLIPFLGVAVAAINDKFGLIVAIISTLFFVSVIIISGDRASWVSLFAMFVFFVSLFRPKKISLSRNQVLLSLFAFLIIATAVVNTTQFQSRLDSVLVAFKGDYESINKASSIRLPIWQVAGKIFADHPVNGIGVRGFRYVYPKYAQKGDVFVNSKEGESQVIGAYHPHQLVLEFLTDTGVIGLIGYLIALWLIFVKWRPIALLQESAIAKGYLLSLMALLFPVNSHLSFFSSNFGQVYWLVVALCVSAMTMKARPETL